jgi:hypothetical protein
VGAEKLLAILTERYLQESPTAITTGNLILKRNGLVIPMKRIRRISPQHPVFDPGEPNVTVPRFDGQVRTCVPGFVVILENVTPVSRKLTFFNRDVLSVPDHAANPGIDRTRRGLPGPSDWPPRGRAH